MKPALASLLVCPVSGAPLTLAVTKEDEGEILEGEFVSTEGRRFPITGGIPRMVVQEMVDVDQRETGTTFTAKWQRSPDFGHSGPVRDVYVEWFLHRYGFAGVDGLRAFLRGRTRILDAGTGVGRDCRLYADLTSAQVFGVDISESIDLAYRHLKDRPNVHLVQADLTRLPFPRAFFDFIACDQVLHHTPDTAASFRALVEWLAPGGELAVYVYRRKSRIRELVDDDLRALVSQMTEEEAWEFAEQLTELGRRLSALGVTVDVPAIPALGIVGGVYDVQRFIYWHVLKCYWNPVLGHADSVLTNFDWYRPRYAHRHTAAAVRRWFADAGLSVVAFNEQESGISARGQRRLAERP